MSRFKPKAYFDLGSNNKFERKQRGSLWSKVSLKSSESQNFNIRDALENTNNMIYSFIHFFS